MMHNGGINSMKVFISADIEGTAFTTYWDETERDKPYYTAAQLEAALKKSGFSEASSAHHPSKPWITVVARK